MESFLEAGALSAALGTREGQEGAWSEHCDTSTLSGFLRHRVPVLSSPLHFKFHGLFLFLDPHPSPNSAYSFLFFFFIYS